MIIRVSESFSSLYLLSYKQPFVIKTHKVKNRQKNPNKNFNFVQSEEMSVASWTKSLQCFAGVTTPRRTLATSLSLEVGLKLTQWSMCDTTLLGCPLLPIETGWIKLLYGTIQETKQNWNRIKEFTLYCNFLKL